VSNHDNPQYVAELLEYMERRGKAGLSRRELLALTVGATGFAALTRANRGFAAPLGADVAGIEAKTPKDTLVVAAPATPSSLDSEFNVDIQTTDAIGMLYDSLIEFKTIRDPQNPNVRREDLAFHKTEKYGWAIEGKLAEGWEITKGGRKVIFQLKKGIKSNWGNGLTAKDVKYTWDRHFALKGVGGFFIGVLKLPNPDAVKVEGPYTVSFETPNPNPVMLTMMVNLFNPIFDSTKLLAIEKSGDKWAQNFLKNNSAGFGPYELTQLTHGVQAVFTARKDYHGPQPAMKTVVYQEVPQSPQRVALVKGGSADVAQYLRPRELKSLTKAKGIRVDAVRGTQQTWIELNAKIKPFDNVLVRQAMNYALPQEEIIKTVYQGYGYPLRTGIPTIYPGATEKFWHYEHDPEKAKALLKKAGLAKGFSAPLSYNAGVPEQEEISTIYQTSLREIGVKLQLNKLPAGTFYDYVSKRSQAMIFYTDAPWNPDPGYANYLYFDSKSFVDYSNYKNPKVDSLIENGLNLIDLAKRIPMYQQAQKIYMNEAPWVFIVRPNPALAVRENVHGWVYYTSNNVRFQDFRKS
jgi:peptide/nickel transport system substrate-binding protein